MPIRRRTANARSAGTRRTAAAIFITAAIVATAGGHGPETYALRTELFTTANFPMGLKAAPGDDEHLYVFERTGRIERVNRQTRRSTTFLDLTSDISVTGGGGLLGLAFAPDHARTGRFYVHYTSPIESGLETRLVEFRRDETSRTIADPGSARTILHLTQPDTGHNGGSIEFSPIDGYLYMALGDGGFAGNGRERAQDTTDQWLGKVLRLDPTGDAFPDDPHRNYAIPADNPFVDRPGDDEIWALGLRNPFRCSFDPLTGDLWIGDVGEAHWEEINRIEHGVGGANLGWGCMEGFACESRYCDCGDPELMSPVHAYAHYAGRAVIGGRVYRGSAMPELDGTYLFADFTSHRVWSMALDGETPRIVDRTLQLNAGTDTVVAPTGFGFDQDGELYIVSRFGKVLKIVPEKIGPGPDINGDGIVDFLDLLAVLSAWGPCAGCQADVDESQTVDFWDILLLLSLWT